MFQLHKTFFCQSKMFWVKCWFALLRDWRVTKLRWIPLVLLWWFRYLEDCLLELASQFVTLPLGRDCFLGRARKCGFCLISCFLFWCLILREKAAWKAANFFRSLEAFSSFRHSDFIVLQSMVDIYKSSMRSSEENLDLFSIVLFAHQSCIFVSSSCYTNKTLLTWF